MINEGHKWHAATVVEIAVAVQASGNGIGFYSMPGEQSGRFITEYKGGWFYFPYKGKELAAARTWAEGFLKLEFITTAELMASQSRYMEPLPAGFTETRNEGSFIKFRKRS